MSEFISAFPNHTTLYHSVITLTDRERCIWSMAMVIVIVVAVIAFVYGLYHMHVLCARMSRYSRLRLTEV